jgi:hypothetical protein
MKLKEWIDRQPGDTRTEVYARLAEESGVSLQTISSVDRGMLLKSYPRAKAISEATGGAVTVEELCE